MPIDIERATLEEINAEVRRLIEAWCDRRCLRALRDVFAGWPLANHLTDGWASFMDAMKNVRAMARAELTEEELNAVDDLVRVAERAIYRR